MIDTETRNHPDFKKGIELYKQGVEYNSDKLENNIMHRGWLFEERLSKCGYFYQPWVEHPERVKIKVR